MKVEETKVEVKDDMDIRQGLVDLSNNDEMIVKDLQLNIIEVAKLSNRLEFLSRILDSVLMSEEEVPVKTMTKDKYQSLCASIIERMLEEKKQTIQEIV